MLENMYLMFDLVHLFCVYLLILLSVISVSFIIERYFFLSFIEKDCSKIDLEIEEKIKKDDFSKLSLSDLKNRWLKKVLSFDTKDKGNLTHILDIHYSYQTSDLSRFLSFLASLSSQATFIGLLGTVFGVMSALRHLSELSDTSFALKGISEALIATALGLFVSIPAGFFYNVFQRKNQKILKSLENYKKFLKLKS